MNVYLQVSHRARNKLEPNPNNPARFTTLLLSATSEFEHYYGPQDFWYINHMRLTVQTFENLNVHLGFSHTFPWIFNVADVPFAILGCDFFFIYGFQFEERNRRLIKHERSIFDSTNFHQFSENKPLRTMTHWPHKTIFGSQFANSHKSAMHAKSKARVLPNFKSQLIETHYSANEPELLFEPNTK